MSPICVLTMQDTRPTAFTSFNPHQSCDTGAVNPILHIKLKLRAVVIYQGTQKEAEPESEHKYSCSQSPCPFLNIILLKNSTKVIRHHPAGAI